jgi:hypothetical protein
MSIAELPMPEDDHVLVGEDVVVDVGMGVHLLAAEASWPGNIGSGQRGSQWWPLATSSASKRSTEPSSSVSSQPPPGIRAARCDPGLEADPVAEAEVLDVGVEVGRDLRVVREVRDRTSASGSPSTPSDRARC